MSARCLAVVCRRVQPLSGATAIILEQAKRLKNLGWSVHIYAESFDRACLIEAGLEPHRLGFWLWGSYLKRKFFAAMADRAVLRGSYDLVHGHGDNLYQDILSLHNCVHAAHEAVLGASLPESSGVGRIHARILLERRFKRIIANSLLMRDELVRRFAIAREKIEVIYPGYDPLRFRPQDRERFRAEVRRELGFGPGDILFGLITSGDFRKRGVETFIRALGNLLSRGIPVKALVIGKESRLGPYLRLAAEAGLGDHIRFLSPSAQVERFYHALDIYVHPALYEEFGITVLEALACGLPVIACERVGAVELMRGKSREFLLQSGDAQELAGKLSLLASNENLRRHLGLLGSAAVKDNTWEHNFAATFACYEKILRVTKKR